MNIKGLASGLMSHFFSTCGWLHEYTPGTLKVTGVGGTGWWILASLFVERYGSKSQSEKHWREPNVSLVHYSLGMTLGLANMAGMLMDTSLLKV